MLTHVQVVHVPVSDQEAAYRFYVDGLGLAVVADQNMGPHGRWLQVAPEAAATTLALVQGDGDTAPGSVRGLVFETDDIEGDLARFRARGLDLPAEIEEMPWARAVRFSDPDGNGLVLQTRASS